MRKTVRVVTAQQHSQWSAAFLLAAVICTAIVFGQGDAGKAVAMIFMFILGALCASHGAKSREKKAAKNARVNVRSERFETMQRDFDDMEIRLKEQRKHGRMN